MGVREHEGQKKQFSLVLLNYALLECAVCSGGPGSGARLRLPDETWKNTFPPSEPSSRVQRMDVHGIGPPRALLRLAWAQVAAAGEALMKEKHAPVCQCAPNKPFLVGEGDGDVPDASGWPCVRQPDRIHREN